ncbi:MAG: hypothetical protein WD970_00365 [Patescibacteria group bacterium]
MRKPTEYICNICPAARPFLEAIETFSETESGSSALMNSLVENGCFADWPHKLPKRSVAITYKGIGHKAARVYALAISQALPNIAGNLIEEVPFSNFEERELKQLFRAKLLSKGGNVDEKAAAELGKELFKGP